jgi:site-specific recombinase XerD
MEKNSTLLIISLFDSLAFIKAQTLPCQCQTNYAKEDFEQAKSFLLSYKNNQATFNAYRRETERLLQWTWLIANKSIRELKKNDIEDYIEFCQNPPVEWISLKKVPRFIEKEGLRIPNPLWRPFVSTVTKAEHRQGKKPSLKKYTLSEKALREIFTITGSFYQFLIQENYTEINPVSHLRQKNHYFRKVQGKRKIRRLSELQWHYVMETAEKMAEALPEKHERTLFIMSALYGMYLRISELAANRRWIPAMNHFYRDHDGLWWFITVGKGNKERQISVSDTMLKALRRYRTVSGHSPLPSPADKSPLIPKFLGKGPITSTSHIRDIVQTCFDQAIEKLKEDGFVDEAEALLQATVHWIRHTGISEDVKHRPREHVRDDAGHSSSAITDKYIDIELRERHASARKKVIKHED